MSSSILDTIDIDQRLEEGHDKLPGCLNSYQTYLRKLAKCVNEPIYNKNGPMVAKEFFNDTTLAKFLIVLGDEMTDGPHALKSARAAIAYGLEMHQLPLLANNNHTYPLTWRAIKVNILLISK